MDQSYFTRSRAGCKACKRSRVKCDEGRPLCSRCDRRGLRCAYTQQLKWVDKPKDRCQPDERALLTTKGPCATESVIIPSARIFSLDESKFMRKSIPRILLPPSLCFNSPYDQLAFDHWTTALKEFVCLDPDGSHDMHVGFMSMVCEPNSEFLFILLAYVASHLAATGIIQEATMISMSQRALNAMLRLLQPVLSSASETQHHKPIAITDHIIASAMLLASSEILRGSPVNKLNTLLLGVKTLLVERRRYQMNRDAEAGEPSEESPMQGTAIFRSTVDAFIYVDVLTGLPCPRAPLLEDREWYYQKSNHKLAAGQPQFLDPLLGYCSPIFKLLGDSRIVLENRFLGKLTEAEYFEQRMQLLLSYDHAYEDLSPESFRHPSSNSPHLAVGRLKIHTESIFAAIAHTLACKIYLLRATDYAQDSLEIADLVEQLRTAVFQVPVESSVITIMLWPLWVLGCESYEGMKSRDRVYVYLSEIFEKEYILNVRVCLRTMEHRIWTLGSAMNCNSGSTRFWMQAMWVRYCWEKKIELTFA